MLATALSHGCVTEDASWAGVRGVTSLDRPATSLQRSLTEPSILFQRQLRRCRRVLVSPARGTLCAENRAAWSLTSSIPRCRSHKPSRNFCTGEVEAMILAAKHVVYAYCTVFFYLFTVNSQKGLLDLFLTLLCRQCHRDCRNCKYGSGQSFMQDTRHKWVKLRSSYGVTKHIKAKYTM